MSVAPPLDRIDRKILHELMQDVFAGKGGRLESGELVIRTEGSDRLLATSLFSRWVAS